MLNQELLICWEGEALGCHLVRGRFDWRYLSMRLYILIAYRKIFLMKDVT